jgi:hypothetical protein
MLTKRICKTELQQEQQTPHQKEVKKKQTVTSRNRGENFLNFIVVLCKAKVKIKKKKKKSLTTIMKQTVTRPSQGEYLLPWTRKSRGCLF